MDILLSIEVKNPVRAIRTIRSARVPTKNENRSRRIALDIYGGATRRKNIPVRKAFIRDDSGETPFQKLYVGGKSGALVVKLYLLMIGRASKPPFEIIDTPASGWARALGLQDPRGKGARKIKNALKKLEELQFIELLSVPGKPSIIRLLSESGTGESYETPSRYFYEKQKVGESPVYFKISGKLLIEGEFQQLSGAGLAMLLVLAAEEAYKKPVWFATEEFPKRYGISAATRAKGTKELLEHGLLRISKRYLDERGRSVSMRTQRKRNIYRLIGPAEPYPEQ